VPVLVAGLDGGPARDLGLRSTFADLGATVAELLEVETEGLVGSSFAEELNP